MQTRLFIIAMLLAATAVAGPTRIDVHPGHSAWVDVKPGDTLSDIVREQVPGNPAMQRRMMDQLVTLNPHAFIDQDPDRLRAHVRLWLPGQPARLRQALDREHYRNQAFSWGYIHQPR